MTSRNVCKCLSVKCLVLFVLFLTVDTSYAVDPDNPPESMRVRVDKSGSPRTFNLEKYSCRGENFELILMGVDGVSMTTIDPGPVRTYRGWCEEEPESYVEATLLSNGDLRYHVFKGASDDWWYDPAFETNENAAAEGNFSEVGGTAVQPKGRAAYGASFTEPAGELDSYYKTAYQADVGFDVLVEYFNKFNYTDLSTYGHKAENAIMHMNGISVRDMLAEHKLGKVVIRQSQNGMDYTNVQWGVDWPRINDVWNSLFPDVDHHFVSLVGAVGGGVAFVCDYAGANWGARSFNGWSGDGNWWHVWRHEAGHNWGCGDCVEGCPGPDGRTVNSGNNITLSRFSNPEIDQFMKCRRRSGRGNILHEIGSYPFPVPPYANLDELQATVGSEALFDLLGNDYDANNDIIAFSSFDASTSLGGLLSLSAGTGPDGRDELLYIAPGNAVGTDVFYYTIVDATGRTSVGKVTVNLDVNGALKGYWPLDETSGLNAEDMSIFEHDGLAENGLSFSTDSVSGRFDGAIDLDGVDQHIAINDLNLYSNTVTISAWVKVPSNPAGWSGIVFNRATDAAGISFGAATELRYHWNGGNWGWGSGLSVPLDTWTFVAIVVEPTKAVIYMNSGGTTRSAAHYGTHEPEAFKGTTYIGWDSSSSSRHMRGSVDDVRIYNYAMSLAQINDLVAGGRAESPSPFDNAGNITLTTKLSWAMGAGAAENDVYFGTNESVVANADVNSDEYMGRQTQTEYEPTLLTNTNYFWRIDQVDTQGSVTIGTVWDFSTSDGTGSITRQVWQDVYGAYVYELTNNDAYPDSPDIVDEITSFEAPTDWADSYGTRIHGFLAPKVSGNYTFWIASDDRSELWLSSNTDPDNAVKIAEVSGIINAWTEPRQWDKHASQRSNSIKLTAGKAYYIMALQKEGNGGDNLSVAWQGGNLSQQVISGEYLMPYSDNYVWGPSFESDPLVIYDAYEGMRYGATLGGKAQARDGGEVTFAKLAGPDWLSVSSEGLLGGVPSNGDVGTNYFVVSAADSGGIPNDAELVITVLNTLTGELGNEDMVGFAGHWLDEGCVDIPLCGGADLTGDGSVDMNDYGAFASMWMIDYGYGGLVSHWPFDVDGSDQTGGNDATLINGAHVTTVGGEYKVGSGAMSFDGVDDYLRADSLCGAVAGMDISIAMWIKSDVTDANKFVCSFNTANGDGNRILIGQKASMADLAVYDNGWLSTGVTAFDGSWHHVVYMLCDSKNEGLVFIDGELEYVYSTTTSIEADDLLSFGQEYDAGMAVGDFFGGQIDDVRVYDRLIADGEIRELMGL